MPELTDKVIAAVVAALVSLVVSLVSYYAARQRLQASESQFDRQLARELALKLYDLRLVLYGPAFDITERIHRRTSRGYLGDPQDLGLIQKDLRDWRKGQVSLIISGPTLGAFRALDEALGKNPGGVEGNPHAYTADQADKLLQLRSEFRRSLRQDIMPLHVGEWMDREARS